MTKRLVLTMRGPEGRKDVITFVEGDVLIRNQGKHSPLVAVSDLLSAHFYDDEAAERARAERQRLTAAYLDNDKEKP